MVSWASGAVSTCMDTSDALGAPLAQMASMTGLSYQVEWEALPKHKGLAPLPSSQAKDIALYSGGDYELVATVRPDGLEDLLARYQTERRGGRARHTPPGEGG